MRWVSKTGPWILKNRPIDLDYISQTIIELSYYRLMATKDLQWKASKASKGGGKKTQEPDVGL